MARLTLGQKADRVLKLLLGLRNPRIAESLAAHGFSDADLAEGWALLQGVTRTRLDSAPTTNSVDPTSLQKLDEWENKWFPVASATLKRRAPEVHAWVFRNLSQTEGEAVVVSVGTFLERLEALTKKKSEGGYGPGGKEAKKLLETRGLTKEAVGEAKALLERLGAIVTPSPPSPGDKKAKAQEAKFAEAEAALWAYYLEWSEIIRTAIKDRKLLRQLGFLRPTGGSSATGGDDEEATGEGDDASEGDGESEAGGVEDGGEAVARKADR
jgi:hypothetical protein